MGERLTPTSLAGLEVKKVEAQEKYYNMLIYGESAVGKTVLAGSASAVEEMSPVLLVDMEGGSLSLHATYPNVEVVRVTTWDEMNRLYSALFDGGHGYKTIIIDSLTEVQQFSMYSIMSKMVEKADDEGKDRDPDQPSQQEWGKNLVQMRKFVRAFRDMPNMHTIFTALSFGDQNKKTGKVTTKPNMTGKFANEVSALVDFCGYYYIKDVENEAGELERARLLLTTRTDDTIAKDRSGKLPQVVKSPTMQTLFDLMRQEIAPGANLAEVTHDTSVDAEGLQAGAVKSPPSVISGDDVSALTQ